MEPINLAVGLTAILVLGISAKWIGWAARIPSILLLLLMGLLIGPVLGWVPTKELFGDLLLPIVSISVAIILFEGGLSLRFNDLKGVGRVIFMLVTFGAAVGFFLTALFLRYALDFTWNFSLLESAILIVTGPTVIIPLIDHLNIREPTKSILKWEGIVIDPIGATLAVLIFDSVIQKTTEKAIEVMIFGAIKTLVVGTLTGIVFAYLILIILRRFLIPSTLHNPVVLMCLLLAFSIANVFQEDAGLISVTVMGLILANQAQTHVQKIADFKEDLKTILIGFLFITLAAAINLQTLKESLPESLAVLAFLIIVARPLSVLASTLYSDLSWKEILFMSFMAPRGIIAAAISALFGLLLAGIDYEHAHIFAPMTFTVIAGTVIFYSVLTPILAKRLGISSIPDQGILIIGANRLARRIGGALTKENYKVQLIDIDYWKVTETKKYDLPVYLGPFITFEGAHPDGFEGLGKLFAMTERDDVNSLAVNYFDDKFDQADIYQLQTRSGKIPKNLMGRVLFGESFTYDRLHELLDEGYEIKTTSLSSEFNYAEWQNQYPTEVVPLFYIRRSGILTPITEITTIPAKGEGKIIFLSRDHL